MTEVIVHNLQLAGFLRSPNSVLELVHRKTWMGKEIYLMGPGIAPRPDAPADLIV